MKLRLAIFATITTLLSVSCAGTLKLHEDLITLSSRIDELRDRGEVCAPNLLAEAEAETAIAEHYASRGQGLAAADHVTHALRLTDETAAQSSHPNCSSIMEGAPTAPAAPTAPKPQPISAGVAGFPLTPMPPSLPPAPIPAPDKDRDGIIDSEDKCPLVAGTKERLGCPPDSDGDGLTDDKDRCPKEVGSLDAGGCPYHYISVEPARIRITGKINFRSNNRKVAPESTLILDEITVVLKDRPTMRLRIAGHTHSHGDSSDNRSVSRKRAEAVRKYLMKNDIDGDRLITIGYGESQPIDDNTTESGREANRRIEFHILNP